MHSLSKYIFVFSNLKLNLFWLDIVNVIFFCWDSVISGIATHNFTPFYQWNFTKCNVFFLEKLEKSVCNVSLIFTHENLEKIFSSNSQNYRSSCTEDNKIESSLTLSILPQQNPLIKKNFMEPSSQITRVFSII